MYILMLIPALLLALYLWMIIPNLNRKKTLLPFVNQCFAHRGIFDNQAGIPENSIPAFKRAIDRNYGIELDVQLTKDKKLVVFHDHDLIRAVGRNKKVCDMTYGELLQCEIFRSDLTIPLFDEVLKLVAGKVPLIIEIKARWNYKEICEKVTEHLSGYCGVYCMESFNPLAVTWFRRNKPSIIRGQLSGNFFRDHLQDNPLIQFLLGNLMFNFIAKPDFIAYNYRDKRNLSFRLCKRISKVTTAAWTIQTQKQYEDNKNDFDIIIFDSFVPNCGMINNNTGD